MVNSAERMKRREAKTVKEPQLDQAVSTWFVKERQTAILISNPVLSIQAHKLHSNLHVGDQSDFVSSVPLNFICYFLQIYNFNIYISLLCLITKWLYSNPSMTWLGSNGSLISIYLQASDLCNH